MKILMVNGSPHEHGCTARALQEMESVFAAAGIEVEKMTLGTQQIRSCVACGGCRETGRCVFSDAVNEFLDKAESADGFVFGSPVHFAGLSGSMTAFMDRVLYAGNEQLKNKPAACLVSARRAGTTAALDQLLKYPMYANMPIVSGRRRAGSRGLADHAPDGEKHGLDAAVHQGRQGSRRPAPRARGRTHRHELRPIKDPPRSGADLSCLFL